MYVLELQEALMMQPTSCNLHSTKKITRKILQVYVVTIGGQQIILYVINYSIYPILNHIQKPFKEQHELFIKMHMTRT